MSGPQEYRQFRFTPPPGAVDLLLVRHGESAAAVDGAPFPLVDGHGDPPLHPVGVEQAARVGHRLRHERIDAVYVTNLQRTAQTAAPLAAHLGLTPSVEPDLREVFLGEWEGGAFRKFVSEGHPAAVRMAAEQRWDVVPGAEPAEAFAARVRGAVQRLAAAHPDQTVAVFTHGGVIGEILAQAAHTTGFVFTGADNASISQVVVLGDQWTIRRYNDTSHLTDALTVAPEPLT
jgi:probable phosphoglycerate mutase